ncbi:MAG: hypothetical protein ACLFP1_02670 [Candidatus Goldiibacteriota bacterium]
MKKTMTMLAAAVFIVCSCSGGSARFGEQGKTYGGDKYDSARAVVSAGDGTFTFAGMTTSIGAGHVDAWIFNVDEKGKQKWSYAYGAQDDDRLFCIVNGVDEGYLAAGFTASEGAGGKDMLFMKVDEKGDLNWKKVYGGAGDEEILALDTAGKKGYAAAGYTGSFSSDGNIDGRIVVLDTDGGIVSGNNYGGDKTDIFDAVLYTDNGNIIAAGRSNSYGEKDYDGFVVMTDIKGNSLWSRTFGGGGFDAFYDILEAGGGYILAGVKGDPVNSKSSNLWFVKIDANGKIVWELDHGGPFIDKAKAVIKSNDGNYIGLGITEPDPEGMPDIVIVKIDPAGRAVDSAAYGGKKDDYAGAAIAAENGYVIAGWTASYGPGEYSAWVFGVNEELEMQ